MTTTNPNTPFCIATEEHLCGQHNCRGDVSGYFKYQFTKIVEDWTDHLHNVSFQITGNKQVTEDIVQEAFLELWLQRVKIMPGNPTGWLLKVVGNLSRKHIRKTIVKLRIYNTFSNGKTVSFSEVEERLIGKEKERILSRAFNKLPTQQQLVLHLTKEKGMRRQEIATVLQLSPNTVKVHLLRAMQFMKEHIGCILLFIVFFACNNIISHSSNTNERSRELYKKKEVIKEQLHEKKMITYLMSSVFHK